MEFLFSVKERLCPFLSACQKHCKGWIMKLTCLLFSVTFAATQLLMAREGSGQNLNEVRIDLELKNESLKTAFSKIEKQTDYRFAYNKQQVDEYKNITLEKTNYFLDDLLGKILLNTKLSYKLVRNKIIIYEQADEKPENKVVDFGAFLEPPDGTVKGRITNEKGEPVEGATASLQKGKGTAANAAGYFTINGVKQGKYQLEISAVGYQTTVKDIEVANDQAVEVNMQLKESTIAFNDVIVTGYSRQSKRDVTGAVSTLSADVVAKTPVTDVGSVLQGRVAGVSVDAQGGPGNTSVVRIRGFGSNGNNDVLYVIDGVQMRGGSNLVNPNDIETITVLKDPSNTALYGAQGGNGVIVITTKTGKRGAAPKLEYNGYASWETPTKYPESLSPQQYADAYWGYLKNSNLPLTDQFYGSGATPVLPDYIITRSAPPQLVAAEGSPAANPALYSLGSYRIMKTNKQGTDWFRSVLGQSFSHSHQLTLSGATDKSNYSLGFGYLSNEGTLLGTYFTRYSIRVNTEFKPAPWLRIGENIQLSYTQGGGVDNHNPQNILADLYQRSPLIPMFDIGGNYTGAEGFVDTRALHAGGNNPVFGQKNGRENSKGYNAGMIGSAFIAIEPIKDLIFESKVGAQFYPYSYRFFLDTFPQNVFSAPYNQFTEGGGYSSDLRWTNKISYDIRINNMHKISAFIAWESSKELTRFNSVLPPISFITPRVI